ncbi:uncharacterized protein LOC125209713 [Salvia hispanica]|uniref:uncharacterized protein LOC125209713 n=1 Tax=Salvia hispanica TaxID=49212 RepID=UPI0020091C43|nr:uncharacterized protein LOC125209713 [Salvia hispanica]
MTTIFHIPCDSRVVRTTVTSVAGLGVQWVSGLQLCVGSRCLIFQLHHADHCPDVLRGFILDSRHALQVGWLVDARMAAHQRGHDGAAGGGDLGDSGMTKDEAVGCSDWEDEELTWDQVQYACHDVLLAYLIALELRFFPE